MRNVVAGVAHVRPVLRDRGLLRVLLSLLAGLVLAVGAAPAPASAHAQLLSITPEDGTLVEQAPATVDLEFNEPVEVIDGAIQLFPDIGAPVALQARTEGHSVIIALPEDLADGTYALGYRIVSADGHPLGGAMSFHVGHRSDSAPQPGDGSVTAGTTPGSIETTVTVLTAAQYLGLLLLAGLVAFRVVVQRDRAPVDGLLRLFVRSSWVTAVGASLLLVPVAALHITGLPLAALFVPQDWLAGVRWQPVAAAVVVLVAGLPAALLATRTLTRTRGGIALVLVGLAVSAPALVGHSQTTEPVWLMMAADVTHLLVGSFWTGGVVGLVRSLALMDPGTAVRTVARFSRAALYSVILIGLSGVIMAVLILDDVASLVGTGYGRMLLVKLGVVAAVVCLAAWNRWRLLPRLLAEPSPEIQRDHLRRTLQYEAALLIAVIAVTGILSNSSPDHKHTDQGDVAVATPEDITVRGESQGLFVDGSISPSQSGANTLRFRVTHDGDAVEGKAADDVKVSARLPDQDLGPFDATPVTALETGEYEAELMLPARGEWQIDVSVRVSRYDQPTARIPVTIQ
ncbi:copper resistance CopC/CopD family protein [Brevibacterium yomogidense]|uniref:copper resistance CopC/CopD family protein n=1 Tax=Brevibacterium yomogidense TaxID=946573 RepID=UPI0018DEF7B4|nr:CopD family protein [Brevibacterium yomogidense]